jgi:ATP-binding cassette, subfamily C, bacterial
MEQLGLTVDRGAAHLHRRRHRPEEPAGVPGRAAHRLPGRRRRHPARLDLLRAVTASSWLFYVRQSVGRLANAMATEAWRASNAYVYAIRLLVVFIETLVYFTVALVVSWEATLVCLGAGLAVWGMSHHFVRISGRAGIGQTRGYRACWLAHGHPAVHQDPEVHGPGARGGSAGGPAVQRSAHRAAPGSARQRRAGRRQEPLYTLVIVVGIYLALVQFQMELATVTFLTLVLARLLAAAARCRRNISA